MRGSPAVTVHTHPRSLIDQLGRPKSKPKRILLSRLRRDLGPGLAAGRSLMGSERSFLIGMGVTDLARGAFCDLDGSYGLPGEHPPDDDLLGRPGDDRPAAGRGRVSDREGWLRGVQRARRGGRSAARGVRGDGDRSRARYAGLKSCHCEWRRAIEYQHVLPGTSG